MTQCLVTEEEKGLVEKVCTGGTARWLREFLDSAWRPSVGFGAVSGRSSVVESLLPKQVVRGSNPLARSIKDVNR